MTLEIATAISIASVTFSILFGIANMKRNMKTDNEKEATQIATVIVKLDAISNDVSSIKAEMARTNGEVRALMERVVVVEQSAKSLHKRVDDMQHLYYTGKEEI